MPFLARVTGARRAEVLAQDAAVVRAAKARAEAPDDPQKFAELLQTFLASPITGMTTMLDYARVKSGYRPFETTEMRTFFEFVKYLPPPLFMPKDEPGMKFDLTSGDGQNPEQLITRYAGSDQTVAGLIRGQIGDLMADAIRNPGKTQSTTLLHERSIDAGEILVYRALKSEISFIFAPMPGGNYLLRSSGSRAGLAFAFDPREWPKHAEEVLRRHLQTVDPWLEGTQR
ncbi:MAG TPA: hypothetical protein VN669_11050 [Candidatus Acidoferrales bacterium]|jgi:hypothetical protein|nr:hypothetical protein [Candidatus Acidoferrales bacterium]